MKYNHYHLALFFCILNVSCNFAHAGSSGDVFLAAKIYTSAQWISGLPVEDKVLSKSVWKNLGIIFKSDIPEALCILKIDDDKFHLLTEGAKGPSDFSSNAADLIRNNNKYELKSYYSSADNAIIIYGSHEAIKGSFSLDNNEHGKKNLNINNPADPFEDFHK